ncbi:Stp1/IreP family PP2C-type Ser/Thr phosphatase [Paenibacillus chondroitinus]|uniref:Stp1/IreP family PP2C-type Ser/Thr phosphatase n=1 Tax=Paenibacillus chondroitinus TaxID=59842 RepID=A0ABU6D5X3_9BACL|nr:MULTISPECIES: Stp1/IreP family PP2C-type Ser/Thr phosphatase [Paenibacillus]MCY9658214.1 Stp1/IreP family PP2C-type Ser/Thr phosphatase [Paenibacillus anseongense]MEB4793123.1 Stp1/IreP family PP2C-type Ser/Thr phosphatase [Paenibacillus chondroitinus]
MKMVSRTDIGKVRLVNEDRAAIHHELNGLSLAIVADGMGGHQAGDIASQMAIDMISNELQSIHWGMPVDACKQVLKEAIEKANEKIYEFASGQESYHGMGTTVVAVIASQELLIIGHIGDSRAYKIAGESITQLTEDHSLVYELVKNGQITLEEADHHPRRNWITRALGTEPGVEVDLYEYSWRPGDIILICTDGLSGLVDSGDILRIIKSHAELDAAAKQLIQSALDEGGDDNVTVVLLAHDADSDEKRGDGN